MWKLQPPPEKSHPLFPSNPPLKVEVLSSPPPLLEIWLETQPPPPAERAGAHYDNVGCQGRTCFKTKLFNSSHLRCTKFLFEKI